MNTIDQDPERMRVLSEAIVQIATRLKIQSTELAEILNIEGVTAAQLLEHQFHISQNTQLWTLAANFVRFYSSLLKMVGGSEALATDWMNSANDSFNQQAPLSFIKQGNLLKVCEYLETMSNV